MRSRDLQRYDAFVWAVAQGATQVEAAKAAGIRKATAARWAQRAEFDELVEKAAGDSVRMLRKRAFELAMGGNIRLLIWLLEHRGDIGGAAEDGMGHPEQAGVAEVEIVGLEQEGPRDEQGDGGDEGQPYGGAFIEFVDDDGGGDGA